MRALPLRAVRAPLRVEKRGGEGHPRVSLRARPLITNLRGHVQRVRPKVLRPVQRIRSVFGAIVKVRVVVAPRLGHGAVSHAHLLGHQVIVDGFHVGAVVHLPHEQVQSEDAEDEVKEQTHEGHVGDARDSLEQRVDDNLHPLGARRHANGTQGAEGAQGSQRRQVTAAT